MGYEGYWEDAEPATQDGSQAASAMTVSAAMALAKRSLEDITVTIVGEVSEVSVKAGYKAAYFTVKDSEASLPCMMWNNRYRAAGVQLAVGQLVQMTGRFTLYAAKGRMNFDVFSIALAGEGDLRLRVANIARKLQAEGLTDPARKRALPAYPDRIGLVTSPRSAAVHDVLRTLRRRYPVARVLLAGVPVEGAGAPAGIIEGLRAVVGAGAQVVLVVRGGGSFEDMMPFNDEALARAIAACPVPVVTGIGHEVDTSIADMVSDLRASTPTAAAEAVSPSRESLDALFASRAESLRAGSTFMLGQLRARVSRMADRPVFSDPMQLFATDAQALDAAADRLSRALPNSIAHSRQALTASCSRLESVGPNLVTRFDSQMRAGAARLHDLSPVAVLGRGYSITRTADGEVVRSVLQAPAGSLVKVSVADGSLECEVKDSTKAEIDGLDER
ncbi:MAG: exodeoxyribonuclease VII large subunit [Eggerthellaceae bacterium]|nr:exodeoxyribonuclease VII large subunit [Eggerthellaceae bacterium]